MTEFNFGAKSSVGFDIAFERNFFLINFDSELFFDFCGNVCCGDGTEEFSAVSCNAGEFNGFFFDYCGAVLGYLANWELRVFSGSFVPYHRQILSFRHHLT